MATSHEGDLSLIQHASARSHTGHTAGYERVHLVPCSKNVAPRSVGWAISLSP